MQQKEKRNAPDIVLFTASGLHGGFRMKVSRALPATIVADPQKRTWFHSGYDQTYKFGEGPDQIVVYDISDDHQLQLLIERAANAQGSATRVYDAYDE